MAVSRLYTTSVAIFINTGTFASPTWSRAGKGVTNLGIKYNPQSTTEQYIHESSASTSTDSYQVAQDLPLTCHAGETIFEYLDAIRRARGVGSAAAVDVLIVYLYEFTGSGASAVYQAERNAGSVAVNDFGGDAGKPVVLNSTLAFSGDPTLGTVVITAGVPVFTATSVSALTLSSVPADGATAFSRAGTLVLTFNNQIATEAIALTTAAGVSVAFTKAWDATRKVLTITPTATLTATTVHLIVVTGVVDIYGQALATTVIDFTTGT